MEPDLQVAESFQQQSRSDDEDFEEASNDPSELNYVKFFWHPASGGVSLSDDGVADMSSRLS